MVSATQPEVPRARDTLPRLARACLDFARSEARGRATVFAALLVVLLVAINALNVLNSYVGRDFMTAVERRDQDGFVRLAIVYAGVFAASTVAAISYRFAEERLGLLWREWLTGRLIGIYLDGRLYQNLQITNPDQRIADDVRSLATSTLSLFLIFLNGTFTIVAFSGVLWSISPSLFAVAVGYAVIGSLLAVLLGRPLVRLNYDQSDREADFRATLVHLRENAESIAVLQREPELGARLRERLDALVTNMKRIIAVNRNLGFFSTGYNYMIQLLPALLVAPLFIRGEAEFGVIAQSSMAFAHVVGAFSLVITQFPQLSSYGAVLARLSALGEAAERATARPAGGIALVDDDRRFAFERLTLREAREGRLLVRELSVEVPPGGRLLVTGSGEATTALQRAAAGLWESGDGRVVRPPGAGVLTMPDRPYLPPGTLRVSLDGQCTPEPVPDDRIRAVLAALSLDETVRRIGGLDVERDWNDVLSLEEQRLVELARILLAGPRFAVLERLESGVGAARAADALAALAARGIGTVLLGDGALGHERFDTVVAIAADGTWTQATRAGR